MQATETCKNKLAACSGGTYAPIPSPQRAEPPPRYDAAKFGPRINRYDGPEDGTLSDRCLMGGLPQFGLPESAFGGSYRRIVQTPGGISMFYDVNQGQGWQRNIVMDGSPHLPANIRQWYGELAGQLGEQYPRHRRNQLQSQNRFSGIPRKLASDRALDADRADLA